MGMRLLLVEDDPTINRIIARRLTEDGFHVDSCLKGNDGLQYLLSEQYDCAILDWMLPERDGLSILTEYRREGGCTPVLMLTARDSISDRVIGLDAGADDYLVKPFAYAELSARVRALTRRKTANRGSQLCAGDLEMNISAHTVTRGGREISLTAKEFKLLEYLLRNQGVVVTREQIADHVWDYDLDYSSNVVDVYIRHLRSKIDAGFDAPLIQTVRGVGYTIRQEKSS